MTSQAEVRVSGPAVAFVEAFRRTVASLASLLVAPPKRHRGMERVFVEQTSTFGIFAPSASTSTDAALSRWASSQGVAQAITMPGVDWVLFCLGTLERQRMALADEVALPPSDADPWRLGTPFQRCVLVHEHFHAFVEVGLGDSPRPLVGLSHGSRLNEALAVWMELHLARGDSALTGIVQAYMAVGRYPDWPYAGALGSNASSASKGWQGYAVGLHACGPNR